MDPRALRALRCPHRARPNLLPGPSPRDGGGIPYGSSPIISIPETDPRPAPSEDLVLLVILGPTGTGKSALALDLAGRLSGEIVGCDALQVYRGFDVATAKPSEEERRRIVHHGVDVADPSTDWSVADHVRMADEAIAAIAARRRVPLVVGGTGMYLRGLLRGLVPAPERSPLLRERLRRLAARHGVARLHRWLASIDPPSAARLSPRDGQRILRALEVALESGSTWSDIIEREGTWAGSSERYRSLKIGLDMDRALLGQRLDARVDAYFDAGLVAEVRLLLAQGVPPTANAFKAIGYREVLAALSAGADAQAVRPEVKRSTRRLAKRQRTWFRKEPDVRWLDAAAEPARLAEQIQALWQRVR